MTLRQAAQAAVDSWDCILPLSYTEQEAHAVDMLALRQAIEADSALLCPMCGTALSRLETPSRRLLVATLIRGGDWSDAEVYDYSVGSYRCERNHQVYLRAAEPE